MVAEHVLLKNDKADVGEYFDSLSMNPFGNDSMTGNGSINGSSAVNEAIQLRKRKAQLESKMKVLESQNEELQAHLYRLQELLTNDPE